MSGEEMYREHVLEHYRNPRNFGVLDPADVDATETNPLCGDEIRITLRVKRGAVDDVRFSGRGCAVSLASASLLSEKLKGMRLADVRAMTKDDVVAMLGIPVSPVRLRCATLPLDAAKAGIEARPGQT